MFDVCGPLPTGVTLLEASAGTGKTFTIAALAARYVAEGLPLDRLLVVTFTRMATGELRERVRERLVSSAEGLSASLAGGGDATDDIVRLLATGSAAEVERRRDRLSKAIADFDAATIETTHGFCLQVLSGLGVAGDIERDVTLVEDARDLLEEVVDDLYIRRFWGHPDDLKFERSEALRIGREVVDHPTAVILPPWSKDLDGRAIRRRLAGAVHSEIDRRKRLMKVLTYDDVLTRLRDTLADERRGPAACKRLRDRYDVVLVDEFQDTDPVQWEIMRRAFGSGGTTLVLIGDPKQAIYAFRGADVYAYLEAGEQAESRATLGTNWRSDRNLIEAFDSLFAGSQLGHAGITYRSVRAAGANEVPRMTGGPGRQALRVRVLHRDDGLIPLTPKGFANLPAARELVARDLAAEVVNLLSSQAEVRHNRKGGGSEVEVERVRPGHLAVLVRTNRQAAIVRDAFGAVGVPAVIGGAGSVFATDPAKEWLRLLNALERPTARDRAASTALTAFVGWTPEQVAGAGEDEWEELHLYLHRGAALLRRRGVAALLENMTLTRQIPARVLSRPAGERFLTDLHHIGQLLHAEAASAGLGAAALSAWLRRRIADVDRDADDEDRSRRLESDAEAVQVLTIHRSKGLEFPIVYCPYLWDGYTQEAAVPVFHDPEHGNVRTIDVSCAGAQFEVHRHLDVVERRGEDLRLLYVALTRAKHRSVIWWAGAYESEQSPLGRLLFSRNPDGSVDAFGARLPPDEQVAEYLAGLSGGLGVERVAAPDPRRWDAPVSTPLHLAAESFDRLLDTRWRRASYTGITQAAYDLSSGPPGMGEGTQTVHSEPEEPVISDEDESRIAISRRPVDTEIETDSDTAGWREVPLLLADMPGGARIGTLIHGVLEATDFADPDLPGALRSALGAEAKWGHLDVGDLETVVEGLRTAIETPLGPLAGGLRLRDVGRDDRLDELNFELPLVGGDTPGAELSVHDIADAFEAHIPSDHPLAGYAQKLAAPILDSVLRGYLTGSLDLVLRLPRERFVVVDYKTNRLAPGEETLTAWHYRPEALQAEMEGAHYPLQAILYTVALHRYLRWRVRGYDPQTNLGGALYLFLRGMSSPRLPQAGGQPCGVWSWPAPVALVEALSDLFDRGRP